MKAVLIGLSIIGLVLTIVPSLLVFFQEISLGLHKTLMLAGMICWFATAPFWMKKQEL